MFSLPSDTAPAAARRAVTVDSYGGTNPRRIFDAQVVSIPARAEDVLDPERHAGERPRIAPRLAGGVDRVGPAPRALGVDLQVAAERAVEARRCGPGTARSPRARRRLPARTPSAIAVRLAPRASITSSSSSPPPPAGPGTMRGTWKKLASRRGAFASASSTGSDGADLVGAQRAVERHRVRHRLDAGGVELAHGVDVVEDGVRDRRSSGRSPDRRAPGAPGPPARGLLLE